MSQISVSQIKAPIGSVFQKHMYSSFIVKMRIDLGSFGLFGSFWVGDNAQGKNLSNLNFWISEVKKVKLGSVDKMGCEGRNVSVSQKEQIFGERSILKKCSILYGGLRGSIWFLKICIWFLGGAKVWVKKSFFTEKFKNGYWAILLVNMWILLWNNV